MQPSNDFEEDEEEEEEEEGPPRSPSPTDGSAFGRRPVRTIPLEREEDRQGNFNFFESLAGEERISFH